MSSSPQSTPKNNDLSSKRRRFQPPITTFFSGSSRACDSSLSHNHYSATTYSPTPTVPAKVQASLLSVGMRVRKSVTEGYKTHAAKAEEKFIFPSQETKPVRHSSSAWAELAPFCGISKTGGSAIQPHHMPSDGMMDSNKLATDDGDTFSLPPSSQESATSFSTLPTVQKRSYDSDYADESDGGCDGFLTPSTNNWLSVMGGTHTAGVGSVVGRTILSPKLGQERRQFVAMHRHKTMDIDDFEEPLFLRRREEVDMDYVASRESDYETEMVVSKSFYSE